MPRRPPPHISGLIVLPVIAALAAWDWAHRRDWRLCRWLRERARRRGVRVALQHRRMRVH